jgi:hypothetical protein
VALAPGIAALVGIGGVQLWRLRAAWPARTTLAVVTAGTAAWSFVVLSRTPEFVPWLRWVVAGMAAVAVLAVLAGVWWRRISVVAALAVLLTGGAAPLAYAADTVTSTHNGGNPLAGPATDLGPGGGIRIGPRPDGVRRDDAGPRQPRFGGPENASDPELVALLRSAGTKWAAATTSASASATLALASDTDVMGNGGFNGGDPAPTLERFQELVAAGEVHYFVAGGGPGGGGPGGRSEIAAWVEQNFTPTDVGGRTVYDLTR